MRVIEPCQLKLVPQDYSQVHRRMPVGIQSFQVVVNNKDRQHNNKLTISWTSMRSPELKYVTLQKSYGLMCVKKCQSITTLIMISWRVDQHNLSYSKEIWTPSHVEEILSNGLLTFILSTFSDDHRFQQDSDPKHTSCLARSFMADHEINLWETRDTASESDQNALAWAKAFSSDQREA